ncbi:HU family DNA-binding protein [Xylanibacter muris]|uniref:HU family DNA-binding protein n=1 Tax=Xylanibacter muris TaxID=2736290 RepID=A0ABX2ANY9_9BACT|nr:HU family DNA-binding protein [Xylanibacter muris]NPD92855.1 HU family DNA-binding protein [Xylanibacter muris]
MNNKDFISDISSVTGYTVADTQKMVNMVIDYMTDNFQDGNAVTIPNFGTFDVKKKLERVMVNPSTQQRMLVPPKLVLNFKPVVSWKDKLKNGGGR